MQSPVRALLWERWRQTRWMLALALLGAIGGNIAYMLSSGDDETLVPGVLAALPLWLSLLISRSGKDDVSFAFPSRLFRLPLATPTLYMLQAGYAVVIVMLALTAAMFGGILDEPAILGAIALWGAPIILGVLGIAWLIAPLNVYACVAAVVFVPMFTPAIIFLLFDKVLGKHATIGAILAGYCLFAFLGYLAVVRQRYGGWMHLPALRTGRASKVYAGQAAHAAQAQYEWRRTGRLAPVFFALLLFMVFVMSFLEKAGNVGFLRAFTRACATSVFLSPVQAGIALWVASLLAFAIRDRDRVSGSRSFVFTRPVSSLELAAARTRSNLRSYLYVCFALVALWLALFGLGMHRDLLLPRGLTPLGAAVTFGMLWLLVWYGPSFTAMFISLYALVGVAYMVIYLVLGASAAAAFPSRLGPELMWIPTALGAVAVVWCFHAADLRGLLPPVRRGIAMVTAVTVGAVFALLVLQEAEHPLSVLWLAVAAAALVPLPIATTPLLIQWQRHK